MAAEMLYRKFSKVSAASVRAVPMEARIHGFGGLAGGQAEERQITERVAGKRGAEQRVIWHLAAKERGPRLGAQHEPHERQQQDDEEPRADRRRLSRTLSMPTE